MMYNAKFGVNDRVILIDNSLGDKEDTPVWGGIHGKIVGSVMNTSIQEGQELAVVRWDNGKGKEIRVYRLKLYKKAGGPFTMEKIKTAATDIHEYVKPYEKYIGLVALAMVIDHFVLGNKFTSRFKAIAEGIVGKITDGLDKLIDKFNVPQAEEGQEDANQPNNAGVK